MLSLKSWAATLALCGVLQESGLYATLAGPRICAEALIIRTLVNECQKTCNTIWSKCYTGCLYNDRAPKSCPKDCERELDECMKKC